MLKFADLAATLAFIKFTSCKLDRVAPVYTEASTVVFPAESFLISALCPLNVK